MSGNDLANLIYAGDYEEAVRVANSLNYREGVYRLIFEDDERWVQDGRPCDEFMRRWYAQIESPYLRAEVGYSMPSAYTVQMAEVPNAERIGANMLTESIGRLIQEIAESLSEQSLESVNETPEHPLSDADMKRWLNVGKILSDLDLPEPVQVVASTRS